MMNRMRKPFCSGAEGEKARKQVSTGGYDRKTRTTARSDPALRHTV